jgi:cardiolipin synthase
VVQGAQESRLSIPLAAAAASAEPLERHTLGRFLSGNRVEVLRDGEQTLPAMFAAIRAARHYVHLEYYVFEDVRCGGETLSDLLLDKCAAGVAIALLYDALGSQRTPSAFLQTLRRAGVRMLAFNPLSPGKAHGKWTPNRRDHRKILIVDGSVAMVGGVNLSASYEEARRNARRWHDTDLRLAGPAVAQLQQVFLDHWAEQGGDALPDAGESTPARASGAERVAVIASAPYCDRPHYYEVLLSAVRAAASRVWITAAYFLPSSEQKNALIGAANRGIDVRLLLPSHNDSAAALAAQRSAYSELLLAGIKIFEREGVILHSKCVIVDDSWSAVGSSNFDRRSARFNDEVDVVVVGTQTAGTLAARFRADLRHARSIEAALWRRRPWHRRALELFWKRWEALL